jgi:glycosyltransferase involved in cell wall biosynthesis
MKIVLITPGTGSYYCGVCMRDNALAKELIRQGHEALMVPMYLPLTLDESAADGEAPVFFGGINVYLQQKFALFRHTPRWLDRLLDARGLLRLAGKQSGMTDTSDLGALTHSMLSGEEGNQRKELEKLVEWLREHKPDAVWLSTALLVGLAREIRQTLGVPVLCSLQGEDSFLDSLREPWRTRCWERLAERAQDCDAHIAPSRFYADIMAPRMRLAPEQLRVIFNGIALDGFAPAERGALPLIERNENGAKPPTIGYLARFIPGKGIGIVVDAFIELKRRGRFPNAKLRCAGAMTSGDEKYVETLKTKLAAAGLGGDVEFLPNVSREEKIAFLKSLTLLSVPATYPEAFGLYLVEALAAGVPVVQPRISAFPELVEATGGGITFEPNTPIALADAWESLLGDPAKMRAFGETGRAAVEREFSMPRMAERFLALTREVADGRLAREKTGM